MPQPALPTAILVKLSEITNHTFVLPLLVFYPTSRCNSRCMSCEWWKQSGEDDLTLDEIDQIAGSLPALGTKVVVFSGGEPLLRPEVFDAAAMFRARGVSLHLLTSGVLLERSAERVAKSFSRVCISLDAAAEPLYEQVRGVAALDTVARGVRRLRTLAPDIPLTARSTLHRSNFRELPRLIDCARALGLDGISFLAADVSSRAFGRQGPPDDTRLALNRSEVAAFEEIVEQTAVAYADAFASGFVAESPERLRRLSWYYGALLGDRPFPPVRCNAPWVSAVLEANGDVRPCFFHPPVGTIRRTPIQTLLTRQLREFRATLDVESDTTCARCVCTLHAAGRRGPWTARS